MTTPIKDIDTQIERAKDRAWKQGKIVWIATWRGRKARIVSNRAVPDWIHEGGNKVKWKVIEGKEWLTK